MKFDIILLIGALVFLLGIILNSIILFGVGLILMCVFYVHDSKSIEPRHKDEDSDSEK